MIKASKSELNNARKLGFNLSDNAKHYIGLFLRTIEIYYDATDDDQY